MRFQKAIRRDDYHYFHNAKALNSTKHVKFQIKFKKSAENCHVYVDDGSYTNIEPKIILNSSLLQYKKFNITKLGNCHIRISIKNSDGNSYNVEDIEEIMYEY